MISKKTLLLGLGLSIFVDHLKAMDSENELAREKQESEQAAEAIERIEPPIEEVFYSAIDRVLANCARSKRRRNHIVAVVSYEEGSGVGLDPQPAPFQPALPLFIDSANNPYEGRMREFRTASRPGVRSFMKDNYARLITLSGLITCAVAYIYKRFFSDEHESHKKVFRRNR